MELLSWGGGVYAAIMLYSYSKRETVKKGDYCGHFLFPVDISLLIEWKFTYKDLLYHSEGRIIQVDFHSIAKRPSL